MSTARAYARAALRQISQLETPETLQHEGVDVVIGAARFVDPRTVSVGPRSIRARSFLLTTGARPVVPPIAGLSDVTFQTYEQIVDNDKLPQTMTGVGGCPIGTDL